MTNALRINIIALVLVATVGVAEYLAVPFQYLRVTSLLLTICLSVELLVLLVAARTGAQPKLPATNLTFALWFAALLPVAYLNAPNRAAFPWPMVVLSVPFGFVIGYAGISFLSGRILRRSRKGAVKAPRLPEIRLSQACWLT